jgi:hypothetical protein
VSRGKVIFKSQKTKHGEGRAPFTHLGKGEITSRAVTGFPAPRSRQVNDQPRLIPFGERYLQEYLPCFRSRKADFSIPGVFDIHPSSILRNRLPMLVNSNKDEKRKLLSTNPFLLGLGAYGFLLALILFHSDILNQRRGSAFDASGFGSYK